MNHKIKQICEKIRCFMEGDLYPIAVAILILIANASAHLIPTVIIATLLIAAGCFVCNDLRFLIMPLCCGIFSVNAKGYTPYDTGYEQYTRPGVLVPIIVCAVVVILSVLFFFFRKDTVKNAFRKKENSLLIVGFLALTAGILLNGFLSDGYVGKNILFGLAFCGTSFGVYLLFSTTLPRTSKTANYVFRCLVVSGLLVCAELTFALLSGRILIENGGIVKESVVLGWGVWTFIGGTIVMLMPACFWFASEKESGWIGFFLGILEFCFILLTQSRGAMLMGGILLLICLVVLSFCGKYKERNRFLFLVTILMGAIVFLAEYDAFVPMIENVLQNGLGDNGRFELWEIGWNHFLENPVFGSGFYDSFETADWQHSVDPYLYHNTLVQMLGACGGFGLLCYLFHRFTTIRKVLVSPNRKKTFLGLCVLGLLLFSLLDVLMFKIYSGIFYGVIFAAMDAAEEKVPEKAEIH